MEDIFDQMEFSDRRDAGQRLGNFLRARYAAARPLVLGVPRGGAEVGWHVARVLDAEFGIIVSKKLPLPSYPEVGFGAIGEDLSVYISRKYSHDLRPEQIGAVIDAQTDEVNRRLEVYRGHAPLPDMEGRTVILVDDGIATGATLVPLVRLCRRRGASRVIIAAPVSGSHFDTALHEADAMEVLVRPEHFYGVGQVYVSFRDLSDDEMMQIVSRPLPATVHAAR